LALGERDLVRRVVAVGPRYVLSRRDRHLSGPERKSRDADVVRARLHRDGAAGRLAREPGCRDHEVLLRVRLVALEAGLVVRLVVELLIRPERGVFPLAVPDLVRVLRPPARALLHDSDSDLVALDEPPVYVLDGIAGGVDLGLVLHEREHRPARDRL